MSPVAGAMARPAGRPVADQVVMGAADEPVALRASVVMELPETLDWGPGGVTVTVSPTVQVKLAVPVKPALSVAVTMTG